MTIREEGKEDRRGFLTEELQGEGSGLEAVWGGSGDGGAMSGGVEAAGIHDGVRQ